MIEAPAKTEPGTLQPGRQEEEKALLELEDAYYELREQYREEHPKVQRIVQLYRRQLREYEANSEAAP